MNPKNSHRSKLRFYEEFRWRSLAWMLAFFLLVVAVYVVNERMAQVVLIIGLLAYAWLVLRDTFDGGGIPPLR